VVPPQEKLVLECVAWSRSGFESPEMPKKRKHQETLDVVAGAELPLVQAMCRATQEFEQAEAAIAGEPEKLFGKINDVILSLKAVSEAQSAMSGVKVPVDVLDMLNDSQRSNPDLFTQAQVEQTRVLDERVSTQLRMMKEIIQEGGAAACSAAAAKKGT